MKCKKIVSGLLVCAIAASSVFTGDLTVVNAADMPTPLGSYSFDDESLGEGVSAIVTGLTEYTGTVTYDTGRTGEDNDKAVVLGEHGLKLPESNIGSAYTVSMWVKLTDNLANFSPVLALGHGDSSSQKWMSVAGAWENTEDNADDESLIVWGTDIISTDELHFEMTKNVWTMLTLTQTGNSLTLYKNGVSIAALNAPYEILNGETQGICVGVNYWNDEFPGLVDDIKVYNSALTAAQVRYLYDGKDEETVFAEEGFTVTSEITMFANDNRKINVVLPSLISADMAEITYESKDTGIATVADGVVTGIREGSTTVTTSVKVGNTTLTRDTAVTVSGAEVAEGIAAEYDLTQMVDGQIKDISGRGNHATVVGASGISFVEEDGKTVMKMASNSSYITLPTSIMDSLTNKEQFTIETTFAKSSDCGMHAWLFCFGSLIKSTGTNYMFLSPNYNYKTLRAGIKNSSTEKLFQTAIEPAVDTYYTVDMVFNEGVVKLYWNGVLISGDDGTEQLDSGYSIMDDVVTPGTENDILGYIGKSCWSGDSNYQGKIASFKIYDKAMTDEDIQLSNPKYQEALAKNLEELTDADILGSNASASEIKYNITLPESINEINVTWESDKPEVISDAGIVTNGAADETVTLTATIKSGALEASKKFTLTVKAFDKTAYTAILAEAQQALANPYAAESSKAALTEVINKTADAATQTEIDNAVKKIRSAIDKLEYPETYKNPFTAIDENTIPASVDMVPGASAVVFSVPASIKDIVTVSYTSGNPEVAAVDAATGVITAKAPGYTYVTAAVTSKYDGYALEYQTLVKVDIDMNEVTVNAAAGMLAKGKTTQIAVNCPDAIKNAGSTVTYRATGSVSVNSAGKVTAKKAGAGTVYVKVKALGKSITRKLTFNVGDITGSSSVKVKKSITLKISGLSGKVKWSVSNKKIATISSKGKLKAKKAGKVTVTAKVGSVTMKKVITVKKK